MAWLAIHKGKEVIYERDETRRDGTHFNFIELPKGSIKKLINKNLEKGDEPFELETINNFHHGRIQISI